jgi:mannose/fructose/N-acetylgalactosamine-specific phosphotransferase system component IIB
MPIVLCRVDDRLVHGQVVIGWGRPLGVQFIVLVDEGVAASQWEQDLYRMAVPPELDIRFMTVAAAAKQLDEWQGGNRRGILLTGDIETMTALHHASPAVVHRINLGGIHHRPGRRERLPYLYLTDEELRGLVALEAGGAEVTAQDLPTSSPVALRTIA